MNSKKASQLKDNLWLYLVVAISLRISIEFLFEVSHKKLLKYYGLAQVTLPRKEALFGLMVWLQQTTSYIGEMASQTTMKMKIAWKFIALKQVDEC